MRAVIFDYVRNIALYIIFMNIILIITPGGSYTGYIKTILGFVLLIIMIKPAESLFMGISGESLEDVIDKYSAELSLREFEQSQDHQKEIILNQFERDFFRQISDIAKKTDPNCEAEKISIDYSEENGVITGIERIDVYMKNKCDKESIKNAVADFYNFGSDNINIIEEIN